MAAAHVLHYGVGVPDGRSPLCSAFCNTAVIVEGSVGGEAAEIRCCARSVRW